MLLFQRTDLKKTPDDVILEVSERTLLYFGIDVTTTPATRQQAIQLHQRQSTNRGEFGPCGEELEFV